MHTYSFLRMLSDTRMRRGVSGSMHMDTAGKREEGPNGAAAGRSQQDGLKDLDRLPKHRSDGAKPTTHAPTRQLSSPSGNSMCARSPTHRTYCLARPFQPRSTFGIRYM